MVGVEAVDRACQMGHYRPGSCGLSFLALNIEPREAPKHLVVLTPNIFQLL